MKGFKRFLKVFVFVLLIILASVGIGIGGGVPIPLISRKEDAVEVKIEGVESNEDKIKFSKLKIQSIQNL
ncbi:MAG TPA: hypothetical protein PKC30_04495 [Saprospiraceae bacterium]|nr:hypothetical protein [Saprospiraceae bacterium]